ncbi:MAG: 1,2-phenylacetyl-CoA epoxidase subunit PaaD [Candidatus Promineifilaceae bacterium]
MTLTLNQIWDTLQTVKDPEIPVISLVELGIVREVAVEADAIRVVITPTFSGCPALNVMMQDIEQALLATGATQVTVATVLAPAWSSDWISAEGKRKLKQFGLAPPRHHGGNLIMTFFDVIECPRCDSNNTTLKNSFGTTLCRAIWTCNACQETFEQFKPI